jgi:hypothetical protein
MNILLGMKVPEPEGSFATATAMPAHSIQKKGCIVRDGKHVSERELGSLLVQVCPTVLKLRHATPIFEG